MARDPNNIIKTQYDPTKKELKHIDIIPDFDIEDYDLNNPKEFPKYIKSIENIVRHSFEYQRFVSYLRQYADMNRCTFLKNVTNEENYKIKIHIHHEPLTLFDITMAVYNKRVAFREDLDEYQVAKEITYLHYKLYVGLIPLSETVHELVHNQYIFVPSNIVLGRYKDFVNSYKAFIEPETLSILSKIEAVSETYNMDAVEALLSPHIIAIDTSGAYKSPKKEEVMGFIKANLDKFNPTM